MLSAAAQYFLTERVGNLRFFSIKGVSIKKGGLKIILNHTAPYAAWFVPFVGLGAQFVWEARIVMSAMLPDEIADLWLNAGIERSSGSGGKTFYLIMLIVILMDT